MRTQQNNAVVAKNQQAVVAAQQPAVVAPQQQAGLVAPMQQALTVPVVTVVQPTSLRAARIARVQVALLQRYRAAKLAKYQQVSIHAKQQAYMVAVQQLAAQMGVPVPNTLSVRAVANQQQHAPSNVQGACKVVRAFVHANPALTRKQVQQHFSGTVNPATVSTQYQLAKNGKA